MIKYPREVKDLPITDCYAIFTNESFQYDDGYGDHGRPSYSNHKNVAMQIFNTIEEVTTWIHEQLVKYPKSDYRVVKIKPLNVDIKVSIDLSE